MNNHYGTKRHYGISNLNYTISSRTSKADCGNRLHKCQVDNYKLEAEPRMTVRVRCTEVDTCVKERQRV